MLSGLRGFWACAFHNPEALNLQNPVNNTVNKHIKDIHCKKRRLWWLLRWAFYRHQTEAPIYNDLEIVALKNRLPQGLGFGSGVLKI